MKRQNTLCVSVLALSSLAFMQSAAAEPDLDKGKQAYRQCVACHSLEQGAHRTGPSLKGIWNRHAGAAPGFRRYSKALKESGIIWDERTLDRWLADPKEMVPGNRMVFRGIEDPDTRSDLIAFLQAASGAAENSQRTPGVLNSMPEQKPANLKALGPNNQVTAITHCGDTYEIATASGETHQFWEFNVRLKTDGSADGPPAAKPVIIAAGMRGDRVSVVFADPSEISPFIRQTC